MGGYKLQPRDVHVPVVMIQSIRTTYQRHLSQIQPCGQSLLHDILIPSLIRKLDTILLVHVSHYSQETSN